MPIYTRTGDNGETGIIGGKRVYKSDLQVEAYGSVDELSAFLGLLVSKVSAKEDSQILTSIQKDLYEIMAFLAGHPTNTAKINGKIKSFEKIIDEAEHELPKLTRFIIPQGTELAAFAHVARTVCRRAERSVVAYMRSLPTMNEKLQDTIRYLNRLSDVLFMLSRKYNKTHEEMV